MNRHPIVLLPLDGRCVHTARLSDLAAIAMIDAVHVFPVEFEYRVYDNHKWREYRCRTDEHGAPNYEGILRNGRTSDVLLSFEIVGREPYQIDDQTEEGREKLSSLKSKLESIHADIKMFSMLEPVDRLRYLLIQAKHDVNHCYYAYPLLAENPEFMEEYFSRFISPQHEWRYEFKGGVLPSQYSAFERKHSEEIKSDLAALKTQYPETHDFNDALRDYLFHMEASYERKNTACALYLIASYLKKKEGS